jgi:NADH-quinone oxidoreductase subunit A
MLQEFKIIFIFLIFSFVLSSIIVFLAMLLITRTGDIEKISAYECGFHPFDDSRATFDVRFYLVAILFIIFDLEITFLFPWSVNYAMLYILGYISMILFIYILLIGFVYEWRKGALEWL